MLRQFLSGSKAILKNKAIVNGQILFPNDASEIYYDINNVRRTVYGLFYVDNDVDLVGIANPEEKLYFSHGSKRVFAYNASTQEFVQVNRTGVVNNLTSAQRNALTSCAEDSIYIDSDTLEMYIGTNMGSNSLSASMFGNVYWHKIGESISNYNGLVSIKTNDKNVLSTNINGDVTIGDSSNSCSINTSNLRLNNNAQNTANGVVVLDNNGKILQSLIPQDSGTATSSLIMETINVTAISPEHNKVYHATLSNNDVFTFTSPQNNNEVLSFRLYLTMPQTLVSFTLPTNIVWDEQPDFTTSNALYMLVFEWNPIINRWLGNLMWEPISLSDYSNSQSAKVITVESPVTFELQSDYIFQRYLSTLASVSDGSDLTFTLAQGSTLPNGLALSDGLIAGMFSGTSANDTTIIVSSPGAESKEIIINWIVVEPVIFTVENTHINVEITAGGTKTINIPETAGVYTNRGTVTYSLETESDFASITPDGSLTMSPTSTGSYSLEIILRHSSASTIHSVLIELEVEQASVPVPTVPVDDSLLIVTNGRYESTFDWSVKTLDGEYSLVEGTGVDRVWECGNYTLKHYEASGTSCWAFFEGENTMPIAESKVDSENPWDIEYMNQGGIFSGKLSVSIVEAQASTINAEEAVSGSYHLINN